MVVRCLVTYPTSTLQPLTIMMAEVISKRAHARDDIVPSTSSDQEHSQGGRGVLVVAARFAQESIDHNCPGFDNDNFGISCDLVATGRGHHNPVIQVNPDFSYHHYFKVVKEHRVQWDPGGSWWFRLGGKPNFKEGGC